MDVGVNTASIALSVSTGISLLAGFFSVAVAMKSGKGADLKPDTVVLVLFGIAVLLMLLYVIAGGLVAASGMAYIVLVKAALLLTAAFAVLGMGFGLRRGMRSGRAIKT